MTKISTGLTALALMLSCSPASWAQDKVMDLGKQAYQECIACHSVKAGENGVGPSLAGVYGTKAGDVPGFRFSGPMKRSGLTWNAETLDKYLENPQALVPGTRMPYSGMADAEKRAALVKYIETLK
ncbi:c-type cytochrome [Bordetella genomosp. 12]|uniref:Cytochrome c family protein n=1 Tax=Bordetella genomosp. 12 TaxID=463035 RepID=A0A261VK47_9BORD|nr:c-type cytochrome [Bordetella genomosp. 12]OZI74455.1 cytochrome c family protein [Bordetella genomosp. 12]